MALLQLGCNSISKKLQIFTLFQLVSVEAEEEFGALESVKASSELICPVSGTVVEVNAELEDTPELVNEDSYAAWIIKVEMSDASQLDALMDAAAYKAQIGE